MDVSAVLEEAGLEGKEASAYLSMLRLGRATASQIAKESGIERTLTYKVLESLVDKGLASFLTENKKRHFCPSSPGRLLERLRESEYRLKKALPDLISLAKHAKQKKKGDVQIEIYSSKEAIKSLAREMLFVRQDYVFIGWGFNLEALFPYFGEYLMAQLEKRGITERVIVPEGVKVTIRSKFSRFRHLPKKYPLLSGFSVVKNKVIFAVASEPLTVISVENERLAKTFLSYFELLWSMAKE